MENKEELKKWYIDFMTRSGNTLKEENEKFKDDKEVMLVAAINDPLLIKEFPEEWLNDFSFVCPILSKIKNQAIYETVLPFLGNNIRKFIRNISEHAINTVINMQKQQVLNKHGHNFTDKDNLMSIDEEFNNIEKVEQESVKKIDESLEKEER